MPELPEVETIRLDLEKALVGDHAVGLDVFDNRLVRRREAQRWKTLILNQRWRSFSRKGKYLWVELENKLKIVFHLRMTGQLLVSNDLMDPPPATAGDDKMRFPRMLIRFASARRLGLYDQRRFAEVWLLSPGEAWRVKNPLGPDALTELKHDQFIDIIKCRTTRIQPLLMDQRLIAGVGNIYAQEALFKAAIRPTRPGYRVTKLEASRLYDALQETLQTAISHRGSSNRNYLDANGQEGSAQTLHAVYRKGGKPCSRCKSFLRATRVGGRGSVFCPQCQK